jgi:nicotinate-nucleotide adenylyltransferase
VGVVRIGVLGGTFNPIHFGHLYIARNIREIFSLSQVHFVVSTKPPHKSTQLIPFAHRYAMVGLAVSGESSFIPSLMELEPPKSVFSIDTMRKFARSTDQNPWVPYFIAGGDSLLEISSWRQSEKLLNSYNFIFVVRPGTGRIVPGEVLPKEAASRVLDLTGFSRGRMRRRIMEEGTGQNRIFIVDIGAPDISATRIRNLAASKKSIRRMVPESVREYIRKLHLYGGR